MDKDLRLSLRTFQRDIKNIGSIYQIFIEYDKSTLKYSIVDQSDARKPTQYILGHLDVLMALSASASLPDYIIPQENNQASSKYLSIVLEAVQKKKCLSFVHNKDYIKKPQKRKLFPYGIKEHDQRWYVFGHDIEKNSFRIFSLDRIKNVELLKETYPEDKNDIQDYFKHTYGVEPSLNEEPVEIIITLSKFQANFLEAAPLHYSQTIISKTKESTSFGFLLVPKHNFIMKLVSYGGSLISVEPPSLKKAILKQTVKLAKNLTKDYD
ncbi:WYL domain-containing protein [Muricauda sp. NFXS6]|uniref:helix-turn-helix transcriptional regulator n=1 Tax=Allomuricauda sp. NFXS6 TaxID=2819094 RepID=UPI0032DFE25C